MYRPKAFVVDDLATLHADIRSGGLATLVSVTGSGLVATHLPLLLRESDGPFGTLLGHISLANTQWKETDSGIEALAIFTGPETYVTPNWYAAKQETGRVVPTWNYAAIHAWGRPVFFQDADRLRDLVTQLTDKFEAGFPAPWRVADAPENYIESQLKAIVGFEMRITRIEGKRKFNQNRSAEDRQGVIRGLRELGAQGDTRKTEVADLMENIESEPPAGY
ncbi:FMN-binding negative transcriptional regulator [Paracidobacterium acidisoli]|uniref:FMN-binding negative transcriptional regulator n=1 Tax=Paracidobacterium acidisoli TaxID=2303751 RepID=A0A372INV0_9BACT